MMFKRFFPLALAAGLAIMPSLIATPAAAQSYGTDAAVGAAVGALVGTLLFDSHRDQYYYYEGPRPIYVSDGYARSYFARRDPYYWHEHRREFYESHERFARGWEGHHGDWHHGYGPGPRDGGDWHHDGGQGDWHHDGGQGGWHGEGGYGH